MPDMLLKYSSRLRVFYLVFILCSCNSLSESEVENYRRLDLALENSNKELQGSITDIGRGIENKAADPLTQENKKAWFEIADTATIEINRLFNYIGNLKTQLKNLAGLKVANDFTEDYDKKSNKAVQKLFTLEIINKLNKRLINSRNKLVKLHREIDEVFRRELPLGLDSIKKDIIDLPTIAAVSRLSKLQNDCKISQQMILKFCFLKIPEPYHGYDVFFPTTFGHNSVYLPGEIAEINAGIGGFSSKAFPEVFVNGKKISKTPIGYYQYRFRVSKRPGKYADQIIINYTDPNTGMPATVKKLIKYKVIPECPE